MNPAIGALGCIASSWGAGISIYKAAEGRGWGFGLLAGVCVAVALINLITFAVAVGKAVE